MRKPLLRAPYPDRIYMVVPGIDVAQTRLLAQAAERNARRIAPKLSGASSGRFEAFWGPGFFGVRFTDTYVWFQEMGIRAFTMTRLAGKVIPMWVDDPTGEERRKNPKAKTRMTQSGRAQVLIFRRAAKMGQRKMVTRDGVTQSVAASYPGAPGRIGFRETRRPWTTQGRVGGRVAQGNVGVRWRHPGLLRRNFIHHGLVLACEQYGIMPGQMFETNGPVRAA